VLLPSTESPRWHGFVTIRGLVVTVTVTVTVTVIVIVIVTVFTIY
jgi:hypothetical protein